jgi:hypothetical protein
MFPAAILSILLAFAIIAAKADPRVLVFTRTTGFRHPSIDIAVQTLGARGKDRNVTFDFTE